MAEKHLNPKHWNTEKTKTKDVRSVIPRSMNCNDTQILSSGMNIETNTFNNLFLRTFPHYWLIYNSLRLIHYASVMAHSC